MSLSGREHNNNNIIISASDWTMAGRRPQVYKRLSAAKSATTELRIEH